MNKKLIALALTAALPVTAMADVTIYGAIKGAFENDKIKGHTSLNRVEDYGSRIGFKGSEDIGNGLKAIWQVESGVSLDGTSNSGDNSTGWGTRQSYIGLDGNFGAVLLGHLDGQLKNHQEFDPWEYGYGVNGLNTFTRMDVRVKNAIAYQSPSFYGFDVLLAYSTAVLGPENRGNRGIASGFVKNQDTYASQVGLNYKHDSGWFANYGFQNIGNSRVNNDGDFKNSYQHRISGGYNANNLLVVLAYQQLKGLGADYTENFGNLKSKEAALTAAYSFGAITPKFTYAKGWDLKGANSGNSKLENTGYDQFIVGVDYALSKRTVAGISYGYQKFDNGIYTLNSNGDRERYKQQTMAVNLVHSF